MHRRTAAACYRLPTLFAGLIVLAGAIPRASAQLVELERPKMPAAQIEQRVFWNYRSEASARKTLLAELALVVDHVDRVCDLSDSQRRKLSLAGRGDLQRFFNAYYQVRRILQQEDETQHNVEKAWQETSQLRALLQAGLFAHDSIVWKSLGNILSDAQSDAYWRVQEERRRLRHQAAVELSVIMLEQAIPLGAGQREALIALLLTETRPARISGQYDHRGVLYQASLIPPAKLESLLDETQWQVFRQLLNEARGMEGTLEENGGLPDDDEEEDEDET